jgi:hypothetical protein
MLADLSGHNIREKPNDGSGNMDGYLVGLLIP